MMKQASGRRAALADAGLKSASTSIRVIRADGSVEEYGVVSYWHRNPLRRLWYRLTRRRRAPVITQSK
jgi:hypothetical protein